MNWCDQYHRCPVVWSDGCYQLRAFAGVGMYVLVGPCHAIPRREPLQAPPAPISARDIPVATSKLIPAMPFNFDPHPFHKFCSLPFPLFLAWAQWYPPAGARGRPAQTGIVPVPVPVPVLVECKVSSSCCQNHERETRFCSGIATHSLARTSVFPSKRCCFPYARNDLQAHPCNESSKARRSGPRAQSAQNAPNP